MARIVDALGRYRDGRLSCVEAAEVLGISERHFRRLRDKYEADGAEGLIDRRRGRASGRAAPADRIEWMLEEYKTRYFDFNAKHFHERIKAEAKFEYGYTWTKTQLQKAGLVNKARRRSCHRKKRPRRPLPGMMLLQDGSPFRWIPSLDRDFDLIATMDDATSHVYSAFLVDEEGTMSTFTALCEVIAAKGLFSSLYTDRGSHYFQTPKAGGPVDKSKPTQVGRALSQLGIQHIPSYSPEARGRAPLTEAGTDRRPGTDAHERKRVAQLRSAASPMNSWTAYRPTATPLPPQAHRSGQMCYQNRTSSRVIDSGELTCPDRGEGS